MRRIGRADLWQKLRERYGFGMMEFYPSTTQRVIVDALSGFVHTREGAVSTRRVEDALYALPEVELAAAWGEGDAVRAAVAPASVSDARIEEALAALAAWERPMTVERVGVIPMTEGFRPDKRALRARG